MALHCFNQGLRIFAEPRVQLGQLVCEGADGARGKGASAQRAEPRQPLFQPFLQFLHFEPEVRRVRVRRVREVREQQAHHLGRELRSSAAKLARKATAAANGRELIDEPRGQLARGP